MLNLKTKENRKSRFSIRTTDKEKELIARAARRLNKTKQLRQRSFEKSDRDNNIETVNIAAPVAGDYGINVLAYNTPFENQGFSLVVTGKLDGHLLS